MSGLLPIEEHLRTGEALDQDTQLVVRGWPLTVDGLLRNADATRRRYARLGQPFVAISAEVTVLGWDVDAILSGPRLRLRRTYAAALVRSLIETDFDLIATLRRRTTAWSCRRTMLRSLSVSSRSWAKFDTNRITSGGAVTDPNVDVTLAADMNQIDDTGYVWAFLGDAAGPGAS
jgi:hypothetical protein